MDRNLRSGPLACPPHRCLLLFQKNKRASSTGTIWNTTDRTAACFENKPPPRVSRARQSVRPHCAVSRETVNGNMFPIESHCRIPLWPAFQRSGSLSGWNATVCHGKQRTNHGTQKRNTHAQRCWLTIKIFLFSRSDDQLSHPLLPQPFKTQR